MYVPVTCVSALLGLFDRAVFGGLCQMFLLPTRSAIQRTE